MKLSELLAMPNKASKIIISSYKTPYMRSLTSRTSVGFLEVREYTSEDAGKFSAMFSLAVSANYEKQCEGFIKELEQVTCEGFVDVKFKDALAFEMTCPKDNPFLGKCLLLRKEEGKFLSLRFTPPAD
jgi:hypothetical protein